MRAPPEHQLYEATASIALVSVQISQDAKDSAATFASMKLAMPVLAVGADHSFGQLTAKNARNVATNVEAVMIEDCGHFVNKEQPKKLANAMLAFFSKP